MPGALLLSVRFHDGRYHGKPDWPPSPARLFQGLVAGAARGGALSDDDRKALAWLEGLPPPIIAAPPARDGQGFTTFVPNNDLDAKGGDPRRVGEIRVGKAVRPLLFDAAVPLLYVWGFEAASIGGHSEGVIRIANALYQLGRGVDMAWARGEMVDAMEIETCLAEHGGTVYRPSSRGADGFVLRCPTEGSLKSLETRFDANLRRFSTIGSGRRKRELFAQAPKSHFIPIAYNSPPQWLLFDVRHVDAKASFAAQRVTRIAKLAETLRDKASVALKAALPKDDATIDRVFIGRDSSEADKAARIRIIPLPSIGSLHAVQSIRRVLVEVPPNCPLRVGDIAWAFSGLPVSEKIDPQTGEVDEFRLVPAEDRNMLRHYGIGANAAGSTRWRTVTPAALPLKAARRRIDPQRLSKELAASRGKAVADLKEAKSSGERLGEERRAAAAVAGALRHAGITAPAETIRVQREPFTGRGERAEFFAAGTRFTKESLWHVEVAFSRATAGPLTLGDGRYLGLGLMQPVHPHAPDAVAFGVPPPAAIAVADAPALVRAVRRALMALSRDGKGVVPRLFSGHEPNGSPAASGRHEHVFLAADCSDDGGRIERVLVAAPWVGDRSVRARKPDRATFERVVGSLSMLRAGQLGIIALDPAAPLNEGDLLVGPSRVWESRTDYRATRHAGRDKDLVSALRRDIEAECLRRGLPKPEIDILQSAGVAGGGGLAARASASRWQSAVPSSSAATATRAGASSPSQMSETVSSEDQLDL